jgi:hypothetical protein
MRLHLAAAAGAALVAVLAFAPPSFAATSTPTVMPIPMPTTSTAPLVHRSSSLTGSSGNCAAVRSKRRTYLAHGMHKVSCVDITRKAAPAVAPTAAADLPTLPSWCTEQGPGWFYKRTEACGNTAELTEEYIDLDTGLTVGTADLTVRQDMLLQTNSTLFTENDIVTWDEATGVGDYPGRILTFKGLCSSPCSGTNASFKGPIVLGEPKQIALVYEDTPGTATPDSFPVSYFADWTEPPTFFPGGGWNWGGPGTIRCDNMVGNAAGCVFPAAPAEVDLSLSAQGAGAANVLVGEALLADGFGARQPLTRQSDQTAQDANRAAICGDGTWLPSTLVVDDSCDEYAFAASHQSGGELGLTGADCAEGIPFNANGQWMVSFVKYSATDRCLRGHVPEEQNEAVGTALSNATQSQRILENDQYYVVVEL